MNDRTDSAPPFATSFESGLSGLKESCRRILEKDRRVFKKVDRFALAQEQERALEEEKSKEYQWLAKLFSCCSRR